MTATHRPPTARLYLDADEIVVDSFAGGGGASKGIELALGRGPDIAINHDAEAIALHRANHPDTEHYSEDVWFVDPKEATRGRPVGLMWLSPDCKHFSKAKGAKPVSPRVRGLAWVAIRWAKAVKPRIIVLENVEEFRQWGPLVKETQRPDPKRKGRTFKMFCGRLRGLGYTVEHRELRGCDFGAPTMRRRLFIIARCDGQPIAWPEPTHGKGRAYPWRTAAECIDFDQPCPSIFTRKKPLAENTLRRIGAGLKRFVFEADRPFIIQYHSPKRAGEDRTLALAEPMPTLDTANRFGLIAPHLIPMQHENRATGVEEPLQTITTQGNKFNLMAPLLVPRYGEDMSRNGGEGQAPRALSVERPLPTIVPTANGASLVAGFMAKHYGGHETPGSQLAMPLDTITSQDHHHLVCSSLVNMRGTAASQLTGRSVEQPLPTISGGGIHAAEVRAFLIAYYSTQQRTGDLFAPMATVTSKDRLGLVTVYGQQYALVDIGMRMLEPRELFRAQGFPDSYRIDIPFTNRKTGRTAPLSKTAQVRMVGNSVCPDVAAAIIRANCQPARARRVA